MGIYTMVLHQAEEVEEIIIDLPIPDDGKDDIVNSTLEYLDIHTEYLDYINSNDTYLFNEIPDDKLGRHTDSNGHHEDNQDR